MSPPEEVQPPRIKTGNRELEHAQTSLLMLGSRLLALELVIAAQLATALRRSGDPQTAAQEMLNILEYVKAAEREAGHVVNLVEETSGMVSHAHDEARKMVQRALLAAMQSSRRPS
jgi:hypothetical protein